MLEVQGLCKRFGAIVAVHDVTFSVQKGEVLGFLGPNGAGKSTTMRMITGYLEPDSGVVTVCGKDIITHREEAQQLMGYLPEGAPAYGDMTVSNFLGFVADVRGIKGAKQKAAIERVLCDVWLENVAHQTIGTLSKGYKRRVGLAQAILSDPPLLILDEPTDGLDPNQKHEVRLLINKLAAEKSIIISTHILEEVEAVCTHSMLIHKGKLIAQDTPAHLLARSKWHNAVVVVLDSLMLNRALELLPQLPLVSHVQVLETLSQWTRLVIYPTDGAYILSEVSAFLYQKGWKTGAMSVEKGRLDEVFRELTIGHSQVI